MLGLRNNLFQTPEDADPFDAMAAAERLNQATQLGALAEQQSVLQNLIDQDTTPLVELDQQRRPGVAGALGAALLGIENPAFATQFAQQVRGVERTNAELAARQALANQVQQGYEARRDQQMTQEMARLDVDAARIKAEGRAALASLDAEKKLKGLELLRQGDSKNTESSSKFLEKWDIPFNTGFAEFVNAPLDTAPAEIQYMLDRLNDIVAVAPPNLKERWGNRIEAAKQARADAIAKLNAPEEVDDESGGDSAERSGFENAFRFFRSQKPPDLGVDEFRARYEEVLDDEPGGFGALLGPEIEAVAEASLGMLGDRIAEANSSFDEAMSDFRSAVDLGLVEPNLFLTPNLWAEDKGFYDTKRAAGSVVESFMILSNMPMPTIAKVRPNMQATGDGTNSEKSERARRRREDLRVWREGLLKDLGVTPTER